MMIAARNAFLMSGAKLPYDAEVEFIESTGTQWVDTGISPTVDTEVDLYAGFTARIAGTQVFGARLGTDSRNRFFPFADGGATEARAVLGSVEYAWRYSYDGTLHHILFNEASTHGILYDGTLVATMSTSQFRKDANYTLIGFGTSGYGDNRWISKSRIASARVTTNGVLQLDIVAVRKNGFGYFYDRVSGELFGNAGTGAFVIGPDK